MQISRVVPSPFSLRSHDHNPSITQEVGIYAAMFGVVLMTRSMPVVPMT